MATVSARVLGDEDPACRIAVRRFDDAERDFNVYRVMFWGFTAILLGFLVAAIVLFVVGKNTSGIVSLVGTVSTSAGAVFGLKRERDARKDAREAVKDVHELCASPEVKAAVTTS